MNRQQFALLRKSINRLRRALDTLVEKFRTTRGDVEMLFESVDKNFWVLVWCIHRGDLDPDLEMEEVLRRIGRAQQMFDDVVSVVEFFTEFVAAPSDDESELPPQPPE